MHFIFTVFDQFSQIVYYTENSASDSSFEYEPSVRINNANNRRSADEFTLSVEEDGAELGKYESERLRNIEERNRLFR
jgi:hypothetical protein